MSEPGLDYYNRRAREEGELARASANAAVRLAHEQLAAGYAQRISAMSAKQPAE
ncbi:MAG: hypothetical protein ACRYG4_21560 [Janthinobacterium lividum]